MTAARRSPAGQDRAATRAATGAGASLHAADRPRENRHGRLIFFILYGLAWSLLLRWPDVYRAFLYANLLAVGWYAWRGEQAVRRTLPVILGLWAFFWGLDMLGAGEARVSKDVRHLATALLIVPGLALIDRQTRAWAHGERFMLIVPPIAGYLLIQYGALLLWQLPFGTFDNPHYLAYSSALAAILLLALTASYRAPPRPALLLSLWVALLFLVMLSHSRPCWTAMFAALLVAGALARPVGFGRRLLAVIAAVLGVTGLMFALSPRLAQVSEWPMDERFTLWADAWRMQGDASPAAWLFGHGLDSYQEAFTDYSRLRHIADFQFPHETVLELLYLTGITGTLVVAGLYVWAGLAIRRLLRCGQVDRRQVALLAGLLVFNFVMTSLAMPFVSSYNLHLLPFVFGILWLAGGNKHT